MQHPSKHQQLNNIDVNIHKNHALQLLDGMRTTIGPLHGLIGDDTGDFVVDVIGGFTGDIEDTVSGDSIGDIVGGFAGNATKEVWKLYTLCG